MDSLALKSLGFKVEWFRVKGFGMLGYRGKGLG